MDAPDHHAHPHHTGHRWLDVMLGLTAVLVSSISLYVAVQHGRTMEKLVAANSWPNVEAANEYSLMPGKARWVLSFRNSGIGPARVRTMEVWDGTAPLQSMRELIRAVGRHMNQPIDAAGISSGTVVGSVIAARETTQMLSVALRRPQSGTGQTLVQVLGGIHERVCFCSVFDDCYIYHSDSRDTPARVDSCPVPKVAFDDELS